MLTIEIPGFGDLRIEHVVMDYNGTLAINGQLIPGVADRFARLAGLVSLHVITADTFGLVNQELECLPCQLRILPKKKQPEAKAAYIRELGPDKTICIGNGRNDRLMIQQSVLGIALIQAEGAAVETVLKADIVCFSILDALDLLLEPKRLIATLRS